MGTFRIFCPAKINAFLAVTGRRDDGFHDLVSLVVPLAWGDDLEVESIEEGGIHRIECDDPEVPAGPENLVWKAAELFNWKTGLKTSYRFGLTKRIPMGAGLGGGSSDAVGALCAMNMLSGGRLDGVTLAMLAAELGSDCPLFLEREPVLMRGRGERLEPVPARTREYLAGLRFLIFKPVFSIGTAWAYGELVRRAPDGYLGESTAEERINAILEAPRRLAELSVNSFEAVVGEKFPAIPLLLDRLSGDLSCWARMSGSGSACFAAAESREKLRPVSEMVQAAWGVDCIVAETGVS